MGEEDWSGAAFDVDDSFLCAEVDSHVFEAPDFSAHIPGSEGILFFGTFGDVLVGVVLFARV